MITSKQKITANVNPVNPVKVVGKREVFEENPFLGFTITAHKRKMTVSSGSALVDAKTGEEEFETTIAQVHLVDETQFIKLFTGQISALFDLSSAGIKTFGLLLKEHQEYIGKDSIYFSPSTALKLAQKTATKYSTATYTRGINDLIEAKIIAVSAQGQSWFFINPAIVFNGDRARFVTEYRKTKSAKVENKNQQKLFNEEEF